MFGVNLKWMNTPVLLEVFAVHVNKIKLITAIVQIFPIESPVTVLHWLVRDLCWTLAVGQVQLRLLNEFSWVKLEIMIEFWVVEVYFRLHIFKGKLTAGK